MRVSDFFTIFRWREKNHLISYKYFWRKFCYPVRHVGIWVQLSEAASLFAMTRESVGCYWYLVILTEFN